MRFGLCGPSYRSQSVNADGQTCMNLYPEKDESGQGNSDMDLYSTPGLTLWAILNTAGGRGITTIQGRSFAVAGTGFFEILPLNASPNFLHRGDVVSDGQPVSFAGGTTQLLLASVGTAYVFDLITNLLTPVAQLNGIPVAQVAVSDDFFFAMIAGQSKIQSSAFLDATNWPGANFTGIQVFSDNPNGIYVDHRELWIFGPNAIQPYFDSGNFPFPFDAIGGAFIESGLAAPYSVAQCDNSLFWLGADRRGQGIVRRANGYTPVRVSDFGVENAIQGYSRIDDAVGYGYQWFGHEIYRLTFPTADATWEFDAAMGMWHEVGFWNSQAGIFSRHRAQFHTANFGQHLVLDGTTGQVYFMDPTNGTDFGNPIRRIRRTPHVSKEQERISINQLQVYLETGLGLATAQQGVDIPTSFTLVDANRVSWRLSIADITITPPVGQIQMAVAPAGAVPDVLQISDPGGTTSWQLAVTTAGVVQTVPIAFDGTLGMGIEFVSQSGFWHYLLQVNTFGVLSPVPVQQSTRAPQLMLRLSDDGGHSWSDEWIADCGKAGEYKARVLYYRLGSYRDFVVELAYSDPTPLRIIDGYLLTDDDPVPQGRLTQEARKRA